jgi:hypothetical protein
MRVLRGLAVSAIGCSKKRNAVGPRLGKRSGCPVKYAASPLNASRQAAKV